jgi:hypothetical protein
MKELPYQPTHINFYQAMIAGIIAGIAEVSVNHPLWVIKTRMQSDYKPVLQLKRIYHGLFSNMLSMVPLIALRLSLATLLKNNCSTDTSSRNLIVSSIIGGSIPSILSSPLEFIRTRQIHNGLSLSLTCKNLIKKNGYRVLSTGMTGTMGRDGLYTCGFFALAPILKDKINTYSNKEWVASVVSKPLAGAIAAFASQPLDTIKTKQQIRAEQEKTSLLKVAKEIAQKEGFQGFFKGSTPRIIRVTSAITIISTVYEKVTDFFIEPRKIF